LGSDGREHLSVPLIAEAERVRIEEQSKKMVSAVRADYDEIMRRYGDELEAWARQELLDRGNRKKTVHTFHATLAFRTVAAHLKLTGPDEALKYAREHAREHLQVIEKLNATTYREEAARCLQQHGEVLPGIERIPEQETFAICFAKKEEGEEA